MLNNDAFNLLLEKQNKKVLFSNQNSIAFINFNYTFLTVGGTTI